MVCAGEATGLSQSRRSSGLEIGCLIDTATGLLTFTSSGIEMATFYQVSLLLLFLIFHKSGLSLFEGASFEHIINVMLILFQHQLGGSQHKVVSCRLCQADNRPHVSV